MRPRNKKNLEKRIEDTGDVLETEPKLRKGKWKDGYKSVRVEVGCGKGGFICGMAEKNPDVLFVGIECVRNVICTAAEKVKETGLKNIVLLNTNARYMADFFEDGEIEMIYLNFSDPWPRDKQEKHRLTSETFLPLYTKLMVENGVIVQKTDNRPLFDFSVETYKNFGAEIKRISYDLHDEAWYGEIDNVVTEYEARFVSLGTPINYAYVVMPKKADVSEKIKKCEEELATRKMHEEAFLKSVGRIKED